MSYDPLLGPAAPTRRRPTSFARAGAAALRRTLAAQLAHASEQCDADSLNFTDPELRAFCRGQAAGYRHAADLVAGIASTAVPQLPVMSRNPEC